MTTIALSTVYLLSWRAAREFPSGRCKPFQAIKTGPGESALIAAQNLDVANYLLQHLFSTLDLEAVGNVDVSEEHGTPQFPFRILLIRDLDEAKEFSMNRMDFDYGRRLFVVDSLNPLRIQEK